MRVEDLKAIKLKLASPEKILEWSHGEITKPETINYRTQRPEKDGLFCERIFGPEKDYECYCGKYRRIRYKGIICDRCGVEVTKSSVRRERMGHIQLAAPVSHIWYLRGVPSRMGMLLDVPMQQLEKVIYFSNYVITDIDDEAKERKLKEIEQEYKNKIKQSTLKKEKETLEGVRTKTRDELQSLTRLRILSELEYHDFSLKYGEVFKAGTGAETLRNVFAGLDLVKLANKLKAEMEQVTPAVGRKILRRLKLVEGMHAVGIRPEWQFLTVLPVLPPDLRPMVQLDGGRYASSDLNDLYRRVINRNNRLKYLLEINAPEVIVRNEKRMLQEAVDALIDNSARKGQTTTATTGGKRLLKSLADILKGKQGRFRQNLLGKRVDYSGRSVIVVGPDLKLQQCGLPKKMALELFKPFVIQKIIERELAYNIRGAGKLIEQQTSEVWAILEEVIQGKHVLLNRAPTLHRLGIQAFQPILIEGDAIRIHPMVCKAFNADFDGDQMAVHVPLSRRAQEESAGLMLASNNLLKPATGTPIAVPTQDMVLACFWITRVKAGEKGEGKVFYSLPEVMYAFENGVVGIKSKIKLPAKVLNRPYELGDGEDPFVETSVGRLIVNNVLPEKFPYQNEEMGAKKLEKLVAQIYEKYGKEQTAAFLDSIKNLGFEYATYSGLSWGMDDIVVPQGKPQIIKESEEKTAEIVQQFRQGLLSHEERRKFVISIWEKAKQDISKLVPQTLDSHGPVFTMIDSSARGSWSQAIQMAGMKGLVANPAGQIIELAIKSSYKEGLSVLEYFIATHGSRKGAADTALRTATAGYLTRRLIDVAHEVIVREESCRDQKGIAISRKEADMTNQELGFKAFGRVCAEDIVGNNGPNKEIAIAKRGEVIDGEKAKLIEKYNIQEVRVFSPISCATRFGICQRCYGWDFGHNTLVEIGSAAGIIAAQAIGEPGTQLTMRTFHTGGVAGGADITQGLPRVNEVFEMQPPPLKAVLSTVDGVVTSIEDLPKGEKIIHVAPVKEVNDDGEEEKKVKNGSAAKGQKMIQSIDFEIPPSTGLTVEEGSSVEKGQSLCEGNIDFKEYFRIMGREKTQRMIAQEIQKIYVNQGANIHDKHIEVIARQMCSRVRVTESGDSKFTVGEVVESSLFLEENDRVKKAGKNPARAGILILGISKVALTTDSFLSAASFQETSRVLIRAALEGKRDELRGLKENVILGKLIPVGTGFRQKGRDKSSKE